MSGTTVLWVTFTLWVTLTTLFALNPTDAWPEWLRFIKVQVMILFMLLMLVNRQRIDLAVVVTVASICFYGVKGGIFTMLSGGQYMVWGPPRSFIAGNTEVGFALVMTVPLLWYLRGVARSRLGSLGVYFRVRPVPDLDPWQLFARRIPGVGGHDVLPLAQIAREARDRNGGRQLPSSSDCR